MRPRQLVGQVVLWGLCVLVLNGAVGRLARTSVPRQVAARIDQSPPITDLFVGNSLMQAGLDSVAFERNSTGRRTLNIALGASSPIEHAVLLRRAQNLNPQHVYYGILDTQLVTSMPDGWGDLVGNRAMAYYLDTATSIRFYAAGNPLRAGLMRLAAHAPLVYRAGDHLGPGRACAAMVRWFWLAGPDDKSIWPGRGFQPPRTG